MRARRWTLGPGLGERTATATVSDGGTLSQFVLERVNHTHHGARLECDAMNAVASNSTALDLNVRCTPNIVLYTLCTVHITCKSHNRAETAQFVSRVCGRLQPLTNEMAPHSVRGAARRRGVCATCVYAISVIMHSARECSRRNGRVKVKPASSSTQRRREENGGAAPLESPRRPLDVADC